MPPRISALVLCIAAQAVTLPAFADVKAAPTTIAHTTATPRTSKPAGSELIKSAAAGTRDEVPAPRATARAPADDDHKRGGGTAMLLAAIALMSGIALRRFGNSGQ